MVFTGGRSGADSFELAGVFAIVFKDFTSWQFLQARNE